MEFHEIARKMEADANLSRQEIVTGLLTDIHQTSNTAALCRVARKRRMAMEFAAERGWQLSPKRFGLLALKRGSICSLVRNPADALADQLPHEFFDHPYFYRRNRRAVAIAAHLYQVPPTLKDFAAHNGLNVEMPEFTSWHYPNATTLVVYMRAA